MTQHTFDIYNMIIQGSLKRPKDLVIIYKLRETITASTQPNITVYGYKHDAPDKSIIVPAHDLPLSYDDEHENSEMVHIIKVEVDPTIIFVKAVIGNMEYLERLKYIGFKADNALLPPGCTGHGETLCDFYLPDGVDDYILCDGFDTPITGVGGKLVLDFYYNRYSSTTAGGAVCGVSYDASSGSHPDGASIRIMSGTSHYYHNSILIGLNSQMWQTPLDSLGSPDSDWHHIELEITAITIGGSYTDDDGVEQPGYKYSITGLHDDIALSFSLNTPNSTFSMTNYNWLLFARASTYSGGIESYSDIKYKNVRMTSYNDAGVKYQEVYVPCTEKPEDYTSNDLLLQNRASAGNVTTRLKNAGDNASAFYGEV